MAAATVGRVEAVLGPIQKIPESLASFLETGSYDKNELVELLCTTVEKNPEIYGATVAYEPKAFDGRSPAFAPYCKQSGGKAALQVGGDSARYFTIGTRPSAGRRPLVSEKSSTAEAAVISDTPSSRRFRVGHMRGVDSVIAVQAYRPLQVVGHRLRRPNLETRGRIRRRRARERKFLQASAASCAPRSAEDRRTSGMPAKLIALARHRLPA